MTQQTVTVSQEWFDAAKQGMTLANDELLKYKAKFKALAGLKADLDNIIEAHVQSYDVIGQELQNFKDEFATAEQYQISGLEATQNAIKMNRQLADDYGAISDQIGELLQDWKTLDASIGLPFEASDEN